MTSLCANVTHGNEKQKSKEVTYFVTCRGNDDQTRPGWPDGSILVDNHGGLSLVDQWIQTNGRTELVLYTGE